MSGYLIAPIRTVSLKARKLRLKAKKEKDILSRKVRLKAKTDTNKRNRTQ